VRRLVFTAATSVALGTALGILASSRPGESALGATPLLLGQVLFVSLSLSRGRVWDTRGLWWTLVACGLTISILGLAGMVAKPTTLSPVLSAVFSHIRGILPFAIERFPDTFHPNVIAATLLILSPYAWFAVPASRRLGSMTLCMASWVTSAAMVTVLALTQSRGALLGLGCALIVMASMERPRLLIPIFVALALATSTALVAMRKEPLMDALFASDPTQGWAWRMDMWRVALRMAGDMPLSGVGFGRFKAVQTALYPLPLGEAANHAHNLLLQIVLDTGFLGLLGTCLALALACSRAARALRGSLLARCLSRACLCSIAALFVHGVLDAASWGHKGAWVMWAVFGLAVAVGRDRDVLDVGS